MYTFIGIIILYIILVGFNIARSHKPTKSVVEKYGCPIAHFSTTKCWNGLPLRGIAAQIIDMDFYLDFVVINGFGKEIVLTKKSNNVKLYGGFINPVFEIKLPNGTAQCSITLRQRNLIKEFFNIY